MAAGALPSLSSGAVIANRYVVTARIGAGGMGDVYEVEHQLLGRRFALKRLAPDLSSDRAMVERFLREARAAAQTGHPAVVEVFDLGFSAEGWPFLIMERLRGETLRERLRRGPIDERMVAHIGQSVLDALVAVHAQGIIHRDLKPENLFLCSGDPLAPRVKVLDFGLVQLVTERPELRLTQSGAVMGTPAYMSPEQARGLELDARTDLYSLAVVLYECLVGRPPFSAEAYSVLVARILEDEVEVAPLAAVDARLRGLVLKALAKRRDDRYPSAAAMRAALGAPPPSIAAAAIAATAPPVPWPEGRSPATGGPTVGLLVRDVATTLPSDPLSGPPRVFDAPLSDAKTELPSTSRDSREPKPSSGDGRSGVGPSGDPGAPPSPALAAYTETPIATPAARLRTARLGRQRWLFLAPIVALVLVAVVWTLSRHPGNGPPAASVTPAAAPAAGWEAELERGNIDLAADLAARAARRAPDDLELAARYLLLALLVDRAHAYGAADALEGQRLPPWAASAVGAARAMQRGAPVEGAAALADLVTTAPVGSPDELLARHARAELLRQGDRFDLARAEYGAVLARWPAFAPAVDGLQQRLIFLDELAEARRVVDRFAAHAPDGIVLDMIEIEMAIAERRYRDALDRVERLIANNPGREAETYQFRGDLRLLLGDVDGAIAAYDTIEDQPRRDEYVAGALLHAGRIAEARQRLGDAMAHYPASATTSRLSKLVVDAAVLALETGDRPLAEIAAAAFGDRRELEASALSARALARSAAVVLAGGTPRADELPLGEDSPAWVLVTTRGRSDADSRARLRRATEPAHMHFGVITTHVYPPLWLERAQQAAAAGAFDEAMEWVDRVVRPRHYDVTRGVVIGRALGLRADLLERQDRRGEAAAVRRELAQLRGGPR